MADQAKGGLGNYPPALCFPGGMPRMMYFGAQEYIITPDTTYVMVGGGVRPTSPIFTDGADWPAEIEPTYAGYSIGRWVEPDGEGRYSCSSRDARPVQGSAAFDASGLPMHSDLICRSSRSASISTRPIRTFFITRSP